MMWEASQSTKIHQEILAKCKETGIFFSVLLVYKMHHLTESREHVLRR